MDFSFSNDLNFNSVEDLPGFEARAAFTVNSQSVFREDTDIVRLPKLVRQPLSWYIYVGEKLFAASVLHDIILDFAEQLGGEHEIIESLIGGGIDLLHVANPFAIPLVDEHNILTDAEH